METGVMIYENQLEKNDIPKINELLRQLNPEDPARVTFKSLERVMEHGRLFLAKDAEGNAIGMATLAYAYKPSAFFGLLEEIVVHENYQGQGISWMLIQAVFLRADDAGMKFVDWTSNPKEKEANLFCQNLGPSVIQRKTNNYRYWTDVNLKIPQE